MERASEGYDHLQRGVIHHVLWVLGVSLMVAGALMATEPFVGWVLVLTGAVCFVLTFFFCHMRTRDERDFLDARFGPVGLFGLSLRYSEIESVEIRDITTLDGIGVHWTVSKGWLYNVRGGKCVTVTLSGGKRRSIGTDDPEGLAALLRSRMPGGEL